MVAALLVSDLLAAAARVGVSLTRVQEPGDLYVWETPDFEVVYIGKSSDARRVDNEKGWRKTYDPAREVASGIVALLSVNRCGEDPARFKYDAANFGSSAAEELAQEWEGAAFEVLRMRLAEGPLSVKEVETLLIRIAVRYGVPIGNSQFASQWENPIGSPTDTLAVLAVTSDTSFPNRLVRRS